MKSLGIAAKLSLAIAIVVSISLGTASLLLMTTSRRALRDQILSANMAMATLVARAVHLYVVDAVAVMREAAGRPKLSGEIRSANWPEATKVLESIVRHFSQFDYVFIQDPQGIIRARVPGAETIGQDFSFRDFFQEALRTRLPYVSGVYVSKAAQIPVVAIAVPALDEAGNLRGVLVGALSLKAMSQFVSAIRPEDGIVVYVVDGKGFLVAHSEGLKGDRPVQMTGESIVQAVLPGRPGTMEFRGSSDNELWLGAHIPVPSLGWGVVAARPTSVAYAAAYRLGLWLLGISAACMAIAMAVGVGLARGLTAPLLRLVQATEKLAAGDLSVRVTPGSQDEVGAIAVAFNHMAGQLQESYQDLEHKTRETEVLNRELVRDNAERQRAEEALRKSEARLRLQIERMPIGLIVWDPEFRVTVWNPAAERIFGFTAAEALGKPAYDLMVPRDIRSQVESIWRRLLEGDTTAHSVNENVTKDGRIITCDWSNTPLREADGTVMAVLSMVQDVTERQRAEERLQQQLSRLSLLNQITRAIGERQDAESVVRVAIQHLEDHLPVDYGCTCLLNPQADTLSVLVSGVKPRPLVDTLGLHEGTTIAVSQAGLREFLEGRTIYVSDSTQSAVPFMRKFAEAGLRSVATASVFVESQVSGLLVVARRDPDGFSSGDCEFLRMLGEHLGLAIHQGQLYTQLQRAYEDLRQTQQVVLQQERLRALGQMASGIAHDINNALSPAALYVESLLEQEAGLSGRAREYLTTIQQALGDVAHTIGRMRDFYRPRESQVTLLPVRLTQVVEQVAELTRPRWRDLPQQRGVVIDLRTDLPADLPPILGIESDLRDACTNLIFNAVDAMPQGGTLTLRVRPISNVERRISNLPTPNPQPPAAVVIEVSDTGVGMDEETRRRCLEPFFTTKGERGTGLGLATVYGTLQRHGGEIAIESAVGRGTTVRLSFPTRAEAAEGARPAAEETPRRNLNLLVVDDDPMLRQSLKNILEADSHAVSVADGGQAGIQAFLEAQTSATPFDVVITDLGMPQVGGREVARAVKAASPSTPVILLTGWGPRMTAEIDIPAQVDWVLSKPPKLRELREALAAVTG